MRAKFIPDREVVLDKDNDLLKTKVYADSLKDIINNSPQNEVFTIGLFGGWGTGKSSIIKTAQQEIESENDKVKFITYDSWKYANDSFRRMFLLQIQEDLNLEQAPAMSRFYKSTNTEAKPTEKINVGGMVWLFFTCIAVVLIASVLPIDSTTKMPIISIFSLLSIILAIRKTIIHTLRISITEPMLFAPEQFEDCFKQMVSKALKQENCLMKIYRKGVEFVRSKDNVPANNLEKIVIVIDNIDRCHNSMAYQLLTDVKTFLSDEKYNIVFVTPVDDGALRKHLFSGSNISNETCNKDKEEFLRKFFNITLRIKPHQPAEMLEFVHRLNTKYELSLRSGTISLLAKEFAKNPRRIIQLLNNLNVELRQYSEEFSKTNESVICAILILKEEYFDFYIKVIDNVSLLRSGYTKVLEADKKDNDNKDSNKEVLSFMRLADSYFGKSTNRDLIKILTNSDNAFSYIPLEIQEAIATYDIDVTVSYINDTENINVDQLSRYIKSQIVAESKHHSGEMMLNWLNFILTLNKEVALSDSSLVMIDAELKGYYLRILNGVTDHLELCKLAYRLKNTGCSALKNAIMQSVKDPNDNVDQEWIPSLVRVFTSKEDCTTIAAAFDKYCLSKGIPKDIPYTDAQFESLFSNGYLLSIIKKIAAFEHNNATNDVCWVFERRPNISKDIFSELFKQISAKLGEMRGKTKDEISECVRFTLPFIRAISDRYLENELNELYSKLFGERGIPSTNTTLARDPKRDTKLQYLTECISSDDSMIDVITEFCMHAYRVTSNKVSAKSHLEALCKSKHKAIVNHNLITLLEGGFSISGLYGAILGNNDYSNQDVIALIKHCFSYRKKEDNNLVITEIQMINI